ncbi:MAG: energy transducer TonB [Bacteroidota bacterium]
MKSNVLILCFFALTMTVLAQGPPFNGLDSLSTADNVMSAEGSSTFVADKDPVPLNMKKVQRAIGYPPLAVRAKVEGTVIARVLINKKGKYKSHRILNEDEAHPILQEAVSAKIKKLKFTPAIKDEEPIPFWVNIPFHFGLKK